MQKITTSQLLIGLLISGLIGGCAAKPTPVPPDVMASNLAGSGAESFKTSPGTSSQMSESGVGGSGVMGSSSKGSDSSSSGTDKAGRFSDIQIQETELDDATQQKFGAGISTEGPGSPVMGSGIGSGSAYGSSKSGGIDPYGGFISPNAAQSGDLLAGGGIVGEGSIAGGIGEFGKNLGGFGSGKDGVDIGFGSGSAGSAGGKSYEPLAEAARLKPFEPTENLQDIHFDYDKYDLDSAAKGTLNKNSDWLKQNPSSRVEIQGHCDERGTNNYNLGLGERRAIAVKKYLIARGVPKDGLFTISYGEERPFCQDSTESCWKSNRRGHFLVSN